jgi:hypothetical protein
LGKPLRKESQQLIICGTSIMEVQKDFRDLLELLNAHKVEYMVVGAYALAFHGAPRYTGDMDIFVKPDPENAQHMMAALNDFGFSSVELSATDFEVEDKVVQLGFPPVRVDLVTSLTGVSWEEAASGRIEGIYGDIPVYYIGRGQFVSNKRTLGRKKDLADLEALGEE